MTPAGEQLSYSDAYARSVVARVRAIEPGERPLLILDRTVFYPGGGGQPADQGTLLRAADGLSLGAGDTSPLGAGLPGSPDGAPLAATSVGGGA